MSGPYYTPADLVELFGAAFTENYVNENAKNWPHLRIARKLRFTDEHVEQIARLHEQTPTTPAASRNQFGKRTRGGAA